MGHGHGGERVGTGPKPTKQVIYSDFTRNASEDLRTPPEDLPAGQRDFWAVYAPLAVEKQTLTVHTVGGFRLLCELDEEKRATKATVDKDGRTYHKVSVDGAGVEHLELKAHPLIPVYGRLAKQVEGLLARYGLVPFGKAEPPQRAKVATNPFAAVAK